MFCGQLLKIFNSTVNQFMLLFNIYAFNITPATISSITRVATFKSTLKFMFLNYFTYLI